MKKYLLALIMFAMTTNAHAGKVSLVGGIDYNLDKTSVAGTDIKGGLGFGGGLLIGLGVFELGAVYLSKTIDTTTSLLGTSVSVSTSYSDIHIPVLYRFGHAVSFGIGGFYDLTISSGGGSNYGLQAGPRFEMGKSLFLDTSFAYGMKSGNSKDVLAMIGYCFGGGK